jgi:uncharacterized protein (TIGR02598 family)
MNRRQPRRTAFSLVEVVIAIALIAFLVSIIIAFLPLALESLRDSSSNTLVVSMANTVVNDLKGQYFYTPTATSYLASTTDVSTGAQPSPLTQTYFFDSAGTPVMSNGTNVTVLATATADGGIYQCTVTQVGDMNSLASVGSNGAATSQEVNQLNVNMVFVWPLQAVGHAAPLNSKTVNVSFSR